MLIDNYLTADEEQLILSLDRRKVFRDMVKTLYDDFVRCLWAEIMDAYCVLSLVIVMDSWFFWWHYVVRFKRDHIRQETSELISLTFYVDLWLCVVLHHSSLAFQLAAQFSRYVLVVADLILLVQNVDVACWLIQLFESCKLALNLSNKRLKASDHLLRKLVRGRLVLLYTFKVPNDLDRVCLSLVYNLLKQIELPVDFV